MLNDLLRPIQLQLTSFFSSGTIYVSDGLDVFFVALVIYSILLLLKKTRSFLILFGLIILGIIYAISRILNLYLTSLALQSIFSVMFLIIIVVFQNEIRRLFEFIALFSTRQIKIRGFQKDPTYISELVQSLAQLSRDKEGALIIITGKDDLLKFTEGGVLADSVISEELVESIFDHHSSGHDGAVIINKNRITYFGTHLPLSNNFKEIGKHGTRHSAALGISELTDCLSLVVSEESGGISVARDGKLKKLTSPDELTTLISKFIKQQIGSKDISFFRQIIQKDLRLKAVSISLAMFLWITFAFRAETTSKDFIVPISFINLSENSLIEDYSPKEIRVTLEGRGDSSFSEVTPSTLNLEVNAKAITDGLNTLPIPETAINHPSKFTITKVQPETVFVSVKNYRTVKLPIKVSTVGDPARNFAVTSTTASPAEIELWLPDADSVPTEISTAPVKITNANESVLGEFNLILPKNAKLKKSENSKVTVAVTIEAK